MFFDRRLWEMTRGFRLRIAAVVVLGVLASVAGVLRLALIGWVLAEVVQGAAPSSLVLPFIALGAAVILRSVFEFWREDAGYATTVVIQTALRRRLYDKLLELGPAALGQQRTGAVMLSVVDGVSQLQSFFGQYLAQLFTAVLAPLGIYVIVALIDWQTAVIYAVATVLAVIAPAAFSTWNQRAAQRRRAAYAAFGADFLDSIQGLATLQAFGQSEARARMLAGRARELLRSTMAVMVTNAGATVATTAFVIFASALVLGWGAVRVERGEMALGALFIVLLLGREVFQPVRQLASLYHNSMHAVSAAAGVFALLDAEPLVREGVGRRVSGMDGTAPSSSIPDARRSTPSPSIAFEDVTFTYPGGHRPALTGVAFRAEAGERVGIVGRSGSGKSTIMWLLQRFYDPDAGRILLDGHDLRDLTLDQVREQMALVTQDTYLFNATVAENLRIAKPDATTEEMEAAARAANALEFIERLPHGWETHIGERGIRLSGGQRQRIAIARALLKDAPILVLDEATSAVDAESEAAIQEALDRLAAGRLTLVMAHRLSSVIGCDCILVVDEGRLVEQGTHADLLARRGTYARLMADQAIEAEHAEDSSPAEPEDGSTAEEERLRAGETGVLLSGAKVPVQTTLRFCLRLLSRLRRRVATSAALTIAAHGSGILAGVVGALIVARVVRGEPLGGLLIALGALSLVTVLLAWYESFYSHALAFGLLADLRVAFFRKLDQLGPGYLQRRRTGDLVGIATTDMDALEFLYAHRIPALVAAAVLPLTVLVAIGVLQWRLLPLLVPLALLMTAPALLSLDRRRRYNRVAERFAALNAHAVDTIQGLREIAAFGHGPARIAGFVAEMRDYAREFMRFIRRYSAIKNGIEALLGLGMLAVLLYGTLLVQDGLVERPELTLLVVLSVAMFTPVIEFSVMISMVMGQLAAASRIAAVEMEQPQVADGPGVADLTPRPPSFELGASTRPQPPTAGASPPVPPAGKGVPGRDAGASLDGRGASAAAGSTATGQNSPPLAGEGPGERSIAIGVEHVAFQYDVSNRRALTDVSFAVPTGRTVAIVGHSGAGKTTVAHLLMRFWDPEEGHILLGGHDLREYRLEQLRARIALVAQDTYLFNTTIRENLLIAKPEATETEQREAVANAGLAEFVTSLPEGLETAVGERGSRLSGGQRQRIAIGRAFLKNAPVLILDEATSHLDAVNERLVRDALDQLAEHRTTVVIAHRLSTVKEADLIVVMDRGRVAETGTHAELLARHGPYARLVAAQMAATAGAA